MPLCSGVGASPLLPNLPASTGAESGGLYPLGLGEYQLIRRFAFGCCHILTTIDSLWMASFCFIYLPTPFETIRQGIDLHGPDSPRVASFLCLAANHYPLGLVSYL